MSIKIKNLTFGYGKKVILNSISEEFLSGEVSVIAGPNGSGKSTLVKCIVKILKSDRGTIFLDSRDIMTLSDIERAQYIGYVSQNISSDFDFTVYEIVEMGRYAYKKQWNIIEDKRAINNALELTETKSLSDRYVNTLSGGEIQRVLLARALAGRPKILILDEPSSNLDIKHNIEIMNLIRNLTKELNITTIMVLHDLNTILHYSDKVLLLKNGSILKSGNTDLIFTTDNIKKTYGVESCIIIDSSGSKFISTS